MGQTRSGGGDLMASARQACDALDIALRLPPKTATWHADRIRSAGLLPSTPGKPEPISDEHIANILLAILVGSTLVRDYRDMPCSKGGAKFGETIARFIDRPDDLFDIIIDLNAPAATVTYRAANRGMETLCFESRERRPRPAFDKQARIGPEVFLPLAAAIKSAPPVRVGRRSAKEKYA